MPSPLPSRTSHVPADVGWVDQVGNAVAVYVCHGQFDYALKLSRVVGGIDGRRPERAVAVAIEHPDRVGGIVVLDQVGLAVAVDVRRYRPGNPGSGGNDESGAENVPSPLPSSTLTVLLPLLPVMMSGLPSLLTFPTVTRHSRGPAAKVSGGSKGAVADA